MRKLLFTLFSTLLMAGGASAAFAQTVAEAGPSNGFGFSVLGIGIGMGIAAAGCGLAQGMAVKAACEGTARNPDASGKISSSMILGLAFIESCAIYALLINLILLFVKL